jgi:photosystem II stability/assembly factor-like uncharacterized protein
MRTSPATLSHLLWSLIVAAGLGCQASTSPPVGEHGGGGSVDPGESEDDEDAGEDQDSGPGSVPEDVGSDDGATDTDDDEPASWELVSSGVTVSLRGVSFGDESHAWAVGDEGTILMSDDGGLTWTQQESGSKATLRAVEFVDATTGWAVGDGDPNAPALTYGAHSISSRPFLQGSCLVTEDGGTTWKTRFLDTNFELRTVAAASALSAQVGTHGGEDHQDGDSFVTLDNGQSWTDGWGARVWRGLNDSIWLSDTDLLAIGSERGIYATPEPSSPLYDDVTARMVGSTNAGRSYSVVPSPEGSYPDQLRALWFTSASTGFAVGDAGMILQTTNGATTWTEVASETSAALHGVAFASPTVGWAIGPGGTLLETENGGSAWTAATSPAGPVDLHAIAAAGHATVIVGDSGTILARN